MSKPNFRRNFLLRFGVALVAAAAFIAVALLLLAPNISGGPLNILLAAMVLLGLLFATLGVIKRDRAMTEVGR